MSLLQFCPTCGATLLPERLGGLCPRCTWNCLFEPEDTPPAAEETQSALPLMRIAGYEVIDEIARGGFGIVYRARQLEPRRTVALKMLLPHQLGSAEMAERFRLEVRALTELEHPSILPIHQMAEHEGMPFFTMKLATGGTLAQRKSKYAGNWRGIAELLILLADAVQFAHERGVLHRDLNPGNVLFDVQEHPYVSDFGLAKLVNTDTNLTTSVDFLGTPNYVAPEIATRSVRQATTASDIYSLGAILYELLTGRPPFEAESVPALLRKIVEDEPVKPSLLFKAAASLTTRHTSLSILPRDLEVICLKCLAREPGRRYASARAFAEDLQRWLRGQHILARPVSARERAWKWIQRNPRLAALTAALALSLIGGAVMLWRSDRQVRKALSATQQAEKQSQQNLREALLAQAKALGSAHATGQRWAALEALAKAARVAPSLELRNEATAALARPDLREVTRFQANIGGAGSTVVFTSDLEGYVVPEPDGFALRRTRDQAVIAVFPDAQKQSAHWFVISPDDRQIAAVVSNYGMEIWPVGATEPRIRWNGTFPQPATAEFNPNSASVAGFAPGEGLFLDMPERRHLLPSTNGRAIYMRFDPSGARMAVVRDPGGVEMWSCTDEASLLWFQPMSQTVPWLSWSPDGRKLAAAANDGRGLRILSAANGQTELVYSQHLLYPRQFEFDPSGRVVASVGEDWALRLWDAPTGQDLVTSVGRHRVMRFSKDGRRLSTAPSDRELAILERAPDLVFREFRSSASEAVLPSHLVRSHDGRFLASINPQLRLFDTARAEEIGVLNLPSMRKQLFFNNDASALLYSLYGKGIYRREFLCTSNANGTPAVQWGNEQLIANHPISVISASMASDNVWVRHGSDGVEIWPQRDPKRARRLAIRAPSEHLAASPNGRWLAAPDYANQTVAVCDCATGQIVTNLPARGVDQAWFSPDSKWVVASVENGYCTWRTDDWRPGKFWTAHLDSGDPGEVAFSDDGRLIAARQEREIFRVMTFPDCKELVTLKPPLVVPMRSACFSIDGNRLWIMAANYRLFEWNLGELRTELAKLGLNWDQN